MSDFNYLLLLLTLLLHLVAVKPNLLKVASSGELRAASTGLEIRERSRCLVCKARLSFAT